MLKSSSDSASKFQSVKKYYDTLYDKPQIDTFSAFLEKRREDSEFKNLKRIFDFIEHAKAAKKEGVYLESKEIFNLEGLEITITVKTENKS